MKKDEDVARGISILDDVKLSLYYTNPNKTVITVDALASTKGAQLLILFLLPVVTKNKLDGKRNGDYNVVGLLLNCCCGCRSRCGIRRCGLRRYR